MLSLVSTLSKLTEQGQVNAVAQTLYTSVIADTIETAFIAVSTQVTTSKRIHDYLRLVCATSYYFFTISENLFLATIFTTNTSIQKY
jgi:hypothetical protein